MGGKRNSVLDGTIAGGMKLEIDTKEAHALLYALEQVKLEGELGRAAKRATAKLSVLLTKPSR